MPDLEAPEPDAVEQEQSAGSPQGAPGGLTPDLEAPEGDALEQAEPVVGGAVSPREPGAIPDANEADVQEQLFEAPAEDEDYGR